MSFFGFTQFIESIKHINYHIGIFMAEKPTYEELEKRIKKLEMSALVLEQMKEHVTITDLAGTIIYVNNAQVKAFGYSKNEHIGRTIKMYGDDSGRGATQTEIIQSTLQNGSWQGEIVNYKADGSEIIMDCLTQAIYDNDGNPIYLCGVATDITEKKKRDNMLIEERDKAQQYFDVADVMMLYLDRNQNVIQINKKGCEILEYTKDEIIGRNWFENFLPKKNIVKIKNLYEKFMSGGKGIIEYYEKSILTKNGNEKIIAWHDSIIKDNAGNIKGVLTSGEDITERKQTEENLQISDLRLNMVGKASGVVVWDWDIITNELCWSDNYYEIFGYTEVDTLPTLESWSDFIHPNDAEKTELPLHI